MNQFLLVIVLIHIYGAIQGSLKIHVMRKTVETVAVIGTACVILQTAVYYLLSLRFTFLIPGLILEENQEIIYEFLGAQDGMFRPSAFFLEPSHYTQYCCIALLSTLFPEGEQKANIKKALWILLGCLLTTSGMGIALCVGIFGWYVLFTRRKKGTKLISLIGWSLALVAAFLVLMQFDFFANSLQRIFGEVDGYNAIWGRTLFWDQYIGSMNGSELWIGKGVVEMPEDYMTGLMELIYCYGYVGVAFLLAVFVYLFAKGHNNMTRCLCVMYCSLMFIANIFSFLSMTFWICLIVNRGQKNDRMQSRLSSK